jgi:hypothetical protein
MRAIIHRKRTYCLARSRIACKRVSSRLRSSEHSWLCDCRIPGQGGFQPQAAPYAHARLPMVVEEGPHPRHPQSQWPHALTVPHAPHFHPIHHGHHDGVACVPHDTVFTNVSPERFSNEPTKFDTSGVKHTRRNPRIPRLIMSPNSVPPPLQSTFDDTGPSASASVLLSPRPNAPGNSFATITSPRQGAGAGVVALSSARNAPARPPVLPALPQPSSWPNSARTVAGAPVPVATQGASA